MFARRDPGDNNFCVPVYVIKRRVIDADRTVAIEQQSFVQIADLEVSNGRGEAREKILFHVELLIVV